MEGEHCKCCIQARIELKQLRESNELRAISIEKFRSETDYQRPQRPKLVWDRLLDPTLWELGDKAIKAKDIEKFISETGPGYGLSPRRVEQLIFVVNKWPKEKRNPAKTWAWHRDNPPAEKVGTK